MPATRQVDKSQGDLIIHLVQAGADLHALPVVGARELSLSTQLQLPKYLRRVPSQLQLRKSVSCSSLTCNQLEVEHPAEWPAFIANSLAVSSSTQSFTLAKDPSPRTIFVTRKPQRPQRRIRGVLPSPAASSWLPVPQFDASGPNAV